MFTFVAEVDAKGIDGSELHFVELNELRGGSTPCRKAISSLLPKRLFHALDYQLEKTADQKISTAFSGSAC